MNMVCVCVCVCVLCDRVTMDLTEDKVRQKARENLSKLYQLFSEHLHCNQWTKEATPLSKVW